MNKESRISYICSMSTSILVPTEYIHSLINSSV